MSHHLTVVHEFGNYAKGQIITDADEIARVLASPQHTNVNRIDIHKIAAPAEEPSPPEAEIKASAAPDLLGNPVE